MNSRIRGFSVVGDLQWRAWNGVVADVWSVNCAENAEGEYVSEDPRLFVVLEMTGTGGFLVNLEAGREFYRHVGSYPMSYIPAGVSIRGRADGLTHIRHLDLHFDVAALTRRFAEDLDADKLMVPRIMFQDERIAGVAALIAAECANVRPLHDLYGDGLLNALFRRPVSYRAQSAAASQPVVANSAATRNCLYRGKLPR